MSSKTCRGCGACRPADEFYARSNFCKPCDIEKARAWIAANPDRRRENQRAYQQRTKADRAAYREENREHLRAYKRRWREANREKTRKHARDSYRRNRESARRRNLTWAAENPDKVREAQDRRKQREAAAPGFCTPEQWAGRLEVLGRRCFYCGGPYETIDHTIPISRGGSKWPANLRPACFSCNASKGNKKPNEWVDRIYEWKQVRAEGHVKTGNQAGTTP